MNSLGPSWMRRNGPSTEPSLNPPKALNPKQLSTFRNEANSGLAAEVSLQPEASQPTHGAFILRAGLGCVFFSATVQTHPEE